MFNILLLDAVEVILNPSAGGDDDVDAVFLYVFAAVNFAVSLFVAGNNSV